MLHTLVRGARLILAKTHPSLKQGYNVRKVGKHTYARKVVSKELSKTYRIGITKTKKIFKTHEKEIMAGKTIEQDEITIKKLKRNFGSLHKFLLEVTFRGKRFFVKKSEYPYSHASPEAYDIAEHIANSLNKRAKKGEPKIKIIKPLVIFGDFEISEFVDEKEQDHGGDLSTPESDKIKHTLESFSNAGKIAGIHDIRLSNLFYNKKTNTLLVFDVVSEREMYKEVKPRQIKWSAKWD